MKNVLKLTFYWRIGLFVIAFVATTFIGFLFPYPNFQYLIEKGWNTPLIWAWGGFDGVHYITIAENGYIAEFTQAFFPVYPLIVRWFYMVLHMNVIIAGLVVSHISLFIAMALFWLLLRSDLSPKKSLSVIGLFLLFPNSFYLASLYSESIFLVTLFGSFLAARKKRWLLAGILGAVASGTRLVGVFLLPALIIEWLIQQKEENKGRKISISSFPIPLLLIPVGLLLYMRYLSVHFGDPLMFIHAQPAFGAARSDKIILLYQVFWRYSKMIMTVDPFSILYFRVVKELFWAVLFLVLGIASFKYSRLSYALFAMLAYIGPTLTGTFSSMGRYVIVMFPAFMVLSQFLSTRTWLRRTWYLLSIVLLVINLSLFITGRWVA